MTDSITMRRLGAYGRFGNQVFQYAFIRTYAKKFGLEHSVAPWVGQYLFGHEDSPALGSLSELEETYLRNKYHSPPWPPVGDVFRNRDFVGWAQYHTSYYQPDREFIQSLFQAVGKEKARMEPAMESLRTRGKTIIGLQIRRGDTGREIFYFTPISWYLKWLEINWSRFEQPVLFVSSEDASLVSRFAAYHPVIVENLGITLVPRVMPNYQPLPEDVQNREVTGLDFFPDWYILAHSDVLLISNSTFGFTASWINTGLKEAWRSNLCGRTFIPYNPWWEQPLEMNDLRDWPGIPGTQCDANPHWNPGYKQPYPSVPEERC